MGEHLVVMIGFDEARQKMVEEQLIRRGIKGERVLSAMRKVPRHPFLDEALREKAYEDHALPIGEGQTISQPYMVALMTEALDLEGPEKVLEIGTGSGYQTAVLAELAVRVYSIERSAILMRRAATVLEELGYRTVVFRVSDGSLGWPEESPFDAIIVTASAPDIPDPLVGQLKEGGRIVIPVGERTAQILQKAVKVEGRILTTPLTNCVFVPLIGDYGWKSEEDNGR